MQESIFFNCKNATVFIILINCDLAWHKSVCMLGLKNWEGAVVTSAGRVVTCLRAAWVCLHLVFTSHVRSSSHRPLFVTQTLKLPFTRVLQGSRGSGGTSAGCSWPGVSSLQLSSSAWSESWSCGNGNHQSLAS